MKGTDAASPQSMSASSSCSPAPPACLSTAPGSGGHILAPKLAASPPAVPSGIVTQKQWVVPPRPKPGRKPATDTPPTKRKAQNRAAQRAFRERRAQRVNELQEKIKEIETETTIHSQTAQEEMKKITHENMQLSTQNSQLREELEKLRKNVSELHKKNMNYQLEVQQLQEQISRLVEKKLNMRQLASPAPSSSETHDPLSVGAIGKPPSAQAIPAIPLPRRSLRNKTKTAEAPQVPASPSSMISCLQENGTCACAESTLSSTNPCSSVTETEVAIHSLPPKRPTSPAKQSTHKRPRYAHGPSSPSSSVDLDGMEVDFTTQYAIPITSGDAAQCQPSSIPTPDSGGSFAPADLCGFCSDGTPCVCAEMAMMNESREKGHGGWDDQEDMKLPPLLIGEERSEEVDFTNSFIKDNSTSKSDSGNRAAGMCVANGGPGTCNMCQNDPLAMLFCQTMASRAPKSLTDSSSLKTGCCMSGGSALPGGCCMMRVPANPKIPTARPTTPPPKDYSRSESAPKRSPKEPMYLPCSAAYKTISRHRNWKEASMNDFPGLVRPLMVSTSGGGQCPEIEIGSITDVLRMLDRKFVKNSGNGNARKDGF